MRATRRSPGKVSLGTPTIIAGPDFLSFHNTHYADRRARSNWKSLTRVRHGRRLALWSVFGGLAIFSNELTDRLCRLDGRHCGGPRCAVARLPGFRLRGRGAFRPLPTP